LPLFFDKREESIGLCCVPGIFYCGPSFPPLQYSGDFRRKNQEGARVPSLSLEQLMPVANTILLVDDNAVQAAVRQAILRRSGYIVITALNPVRALEQLRHGDFPSEVQLVVTDHVMPGMSGTEFVQQIRQFDSKIPILVISGMEEAAEQYEGLGVEFRVKPLPPENLLSCVRELVLQANSRGIHASVVPAPPIAR
jgi:CheY-like chemotaxis protein